MCETLHPNVDKSMAFLKICCFTLARAACESIMLYNTKLAAVILQSFNESISSIRYDNQKSTTVINPSIFPKIVSSTVSSLISPLTPRDIQTQTIHFLHNGKLQGERQKRKQ